MATDPYTYEEFFDTQDSGFGGWYTGMDRGWSAAETGGPTPVEKLKGFGGGLMALLGEVGDSLHYRDQEGKLRKRLKDTKEEQVLDAEVPVLEDGPVEAPEMGSQVEPLRAASNPAIPGYNQNDEFVGPPLPSDYGITPPSDEFVGPPAPGDSYMSQGALDDEAANAERLQALYNQEPVYKRTRSLDDHGSISQTPYTTADQGIPRSEYEKAAGDAVNAFYTIQFGRGLLGRARNLLSKLKWGTKNYPLPNPNKPSYPQLEGGRPRLTGGGHPQLGTPPSGRAIPMGSTSRGSGPTINMGGSPADMPPYDPAYQPFFSRMNNVPDSPRMRGVEAGPGFANPISRYKGQATARANSLAERNARLDAEMAEIARMASTRNFLRIPAE